MAELRDLYILGALPSDACEEVEAHLETCEACRYEAALSWRSARALRFGVPQVEPPEALRSRMLASALVPGVSSSKFQVPSPKSRLLRLRTLNLGLGTWNLRWAALGTLLVLVLGGWLSMEVVRLQGQVESSELALRRSGESGQMAAEILGRGIQTGAAMARVDGTEMAPGAAGMLYYGPATREGVLLVAGLPEPARGHVYQLWLIRGEDRMSGGIFQLEDGGRGMLVVRSPMPLAAVDAVGITMEPPGGSPNPSGQRYMWGRLNAG